MNLFYGGHGVDRRGNAGHLLIVNQLQNQDIQRGQPGQLLSHHLLAPKVDHAHLAVLHNLDIHNGKVRPDPFHMLAALVILPVQLIPFRPPVILAFQQKRLPVQKLHRFLDLQLLLW